MQLIPAIDIRNGQCVRLRQGDPDQQTNYDVIPVEMAWQFYHAGVDKIHIVDLDAAFSGTSVNNAVIDELLKVPVEIELGGGIRTLQQMEYWLDKNVAQVILGTAAIATPQWVRQAIVNYGPHRIIIGLDAKAGWVATHGWQTISEIKALEFAQNMVNLGVERFIYTDIAADGMFSGPNLADLTELANHLSAKITASGGIRDLSHLIAIKNLAMPNLDSVIVGRAIYEGQIDVAEAIKVLRDVN